MVNTEQSRNCLEAIKFAAGSLKYKGISINKTFLMSIKFLQGYYLIDRDLRYLEVATLLIQAYLEMGFTYESCQEEFDDILKDLGTERSLMFPKKFYHSKKIKLTRPQVRSMIGKWSSSKKNKMLIITVVDDIINKVNNKEIGVYSYCNHNISGKELYELVINIDEVYFHDINKCKYYTFFIEN
ncbi:MAG: hypothetical protein K0R05_3445 [Anaerocolumna sp.]|nr:hypothetical protein [Anaerocolumna sp.]